MNLFKESLFSMIWQSARTHVVTILVVMCASYAVFSHFKKMRYDMSGKLQQLEMIQEGEVKKIRAAQEEERKANEASIKKLQDDLAEARKSYEDGLKLLEEKRNKEIAKLMGKYGNDALGMTNQISKVTGFPVYTPLGK